MLFENTQISGSRKAYRVDVILKPFNYEKKDTFSNNAIVGLNS